MHKRTGRLLIALMALALILGGGYLALRPQEDGESGGMCRLIIRCDTILDHMDELDASKREYVPADGRILDTGEVSFRKGDSAFDLLKREITGRNMQFEFKKLPVSGGVYVEGIANLYEFDVGELSGWQFSINGVFGGEDCGSYRLHDGDTIAFLYTCDLGKDIGGSIYE